MTGLLILLCLLLIGVVVVQIGRLTELAVKIRGEEEAQYETNNFNARLAVFFMVTFLLACIVSAIYYKDSMLGFGPHEAASEHGDMLDAAFNKTLFFTSVVFFITQIALFWFAYKYRGRRGHSASFMPHDNKLEIIWTAVPAIVMFYLVADGLVKWNDVMADIPQEAVAGEDYIEIEATGMQFAWNLRYPGPDNALGARTYENISGTNPLGQDWTDNKNLDDIHPSEIVLPVGKQVRVRILAQDVLHNFYLPHFRLKMDAVPGMPTYFVFTPKTTTEEYRQRLGALGRDGMPLYPEWHEPADPTEPNGPKRWEAFEYELACAELCGNGHFSMRRLVKIVSEEEYQDWLDQQNSFYFSNVRNTKDDPHLGKLFDFEIRDRKAEFDAAFQQALVSDTNKIVRLNYVHFETNSANLTTLSRYELDNVVTVLNQHPNMTIELGGHTDSQGEDEFNLDLSNERANAVANYLRSKGISEDRYIAVGYGEARPIDSNATAEGRQNNRRTEFRILTQ